MDQNAYTKPPPYAQMPPESNLYQAGAPPMAHSTPPAYGHGYAQQPHPQQPPMAYAVPMPVQPTQVIVVGGCPSCRVGVLEDDYSCCGVLLAILFFPIGILCCLAMKQRRCPNCGAIFG